MAFVLVVVTAASIFTLAFSAAAGTGGCRHVAGTLYNGDPGRMIGSLSGEYRIDWDGLWYAEMFPANPANPAPPPIFVVGLPSVVETNRGDIEFEEYSARDTEVQEGTNGVVLMIVTGGTGYWEGASGLVTMTGYWHDVDGQGQWDYRGEVCRP
jgi:hypothetical protein